MKAKIKQGPVAHKCHARGCDRNVPEAIFMCALHWKRLPRRLRSGIWASYVRGQEIRKDPTPAYLEAAQEAISWLAEVEGK